MRQFTPRKGRLNRGRSHMRRSCWNVLNLILRWRGKGDDTLRRSGRVRRHRSAVGRDGLSLILFGKVLRCGSVVGNTAHRSEGG